MILPGKSFAKASLGSPAPDFTLRDQYDSTFTLSTAHGEVVLIFCGDRHGNAYIDNYTRPVRERFSDGSKWSVRVVLVANLKGVPAFLRGLVARRFRGKTADGRQRRAVLLDWRGTLARQYRFKESLTNVYLVDRSGMLRYTAAGRGLPEEIASLLAALNEAVNDREPGLLRWTH